jgi:hypothetical protein
MVKVMGGGKVYVKSHGRVCVALDALKRALSTLHNPDLGLVYYFYLSLRLSETTSSNLSACRSNVLPVEKFSKACPITSSTALQPSLSMKQSIADVDPGRGLTQKRVELCHPIRIQRQAHPRKMITKSTMIYL